jgi:hypothetical protein
VLAAMQFSGSIAIKRSSAINAVTTATKGSPLGQYLQHFEILAIHNHKPLIYNGHYFLDGTIWCCPYFVINHIVTPLPMVSN